MRVFEKSGKTFWYNERSDGKLDVYDGRHWVYGVDRDAFFDKGRLVTYKKVDFGDRTGTQTLHNKEVHFMARVKTINVPTYAVEATVKDFLSALPQFNDTVQEKVWRALPKAAVGVGDALSRVVTVSCADEAEATAIAALVNKFSPTRKVAVQSFTDWHTYYDVETQNGRAVACTCPDFVHRSEKDPTHVCKHMQAVNNRPRNYGL